MIKLYIEVFSTLVPLFGLLIFILLCWYFILIWRKPYFLCFCLNKLKVVIVFEIQYCASTWYQLKWFTEFLLGGGIMNSWILYQNHKIINLRTCFHESNFWRIFLKISKCYSWKHMAIDHIRNYTSVLVKNVSPSHMTITIAILKCKCHAVSVLV